MWRGEDRAGVAPSLKPGQSLVLLPPKEGEGDNAPAGYLSPVRRALIEDNRRHVNIVVCEADYHALKRGIEHLSPPLQ
jgi:hypothetical protein